MSTFTTYYPYAEYRNVNIGRAAELVNGTVLKPGETFSLNDTVGERTRENGFTEGFIISNGIFKEDLGGGVSQMATTTFNAMFFAGLKDVEHKPHSFYIDRYPEGREATVAWGAVDLRFQNDTPYGVLISAHVTPSTPSSQGVVTVSMYSTKYWDITTSTSDRYNYTSEQTRTLRTEDCYPNDGYGGFDVDVTRYFKKPGESRARPPGEVPHDVHPLRHGHLQAAQELTAVAKAASNRARGRCVDRTCPGCLLRHATSSSRRSPPSIVIGPVRLASQADAAPLPYPTSPFGEPTGANDWGCRRPRSARRRS